MGRITQAQLDEAVKQPDDLAQKARSLINTGQISEAIPLLERLERENPFQAWAFEDHAYVMLRHRKYTEAARVADRGLQTNPDSVSLKRTLAEALSHIAGEEDRAEKYFQELQRDFPGDPKFLSTYADFLVRRDRHEQARQIYDLILTRGFRKADKAHVRIDLASSYRLDRKPDQGLRVLDESPMPEDPFWLREKGHCLVEMGDGDTARPLLARARQLMSDRPQRARTGFYSRLEPMEKSAEALTGKWKEVIPWVLSRQSLQPWARATVWRSIRKAIKGQGNVDEAIETLLQNLSHFQKDTTIAYEIGRLVAEAKPPDERRHQIINQALTIAPHNPSVLEMAAQNESGESAEYFWKRAWSELISVEPSPSTTASKVACHYSYFLRHLGRCEDALAIVEQARTELAIHDWELELERAICLARLGNYSEANDILKRLDDQRPDNPVVLDQWGVCLRTMGRLEEALDVYQRKLKIQDDLPGRQGLGRTLFELGRHEEAQKVFEKILGEAPDDAEAKWHLAEILSARGELDQAQQILKEIAPVDLAKRGREIFGIEQKIAELERRILEQQAELEQAQKLAYLGTMATATAHELNQPIGIIRAQTDAALSDLRAGLLAQDEIQPILEKILAQTERLARIIENLRAFARSDRTKRERVELNPLVERVTQMFAEQFKHRGIKLQVEPCRSQPPPIAWANPVQLEEVLINLLTNARDAVESRPNAAVWVKCWRRHGGGSAFSVEDNGLGLPPEYRQKIFTPFVSTKPTEKGTGLGLFISHRLVSDLGGRLFYEDPPNGGTRFVVHLPPVKGV